MQSQSKSWITAVGVAGIISVTSLVGLVGCGASQGNQPKAQELGVPTSTGFATPEECAKVADHLFTIELHGTAANVPEEHLLDGSNTERRAQFNSFVTKCETKLSHSDAACILAAPAFQYVKQCEITQGTPSLFPERIGQAHRIPGDF